MNLEEIGLWAGSEETLAAYVLQLKKYVEAGSPPRSAYGADIYDATGDTAPTPRLFSQEGSVGIVKISGPLNNRAGWLNEVFGATGYPEIRDALIYAAQQETVKTILLDIASGGGAVAGVSDAADLIAKIDTQVKPVHAFTDGGMMSAAYWLGASARSVTASKTADVGSLGVIRVHMEQSRLLKDAGVTPTVIKAGQYKGLGNPYQPLTEADKAELQSQVDYAYTLFLSHVAEQRGVSYAVADQRMGQGKVFTGAQAQTAGLVDQISNYDDLISRLEASAKEKIAPGIAFAKTTPQYGANSTQGTDMKKALTAQQIAALAEGGAVTDAAATTEAASAVTEAATEVAPAEVTPAAEAAAEAAAATAQEAPKDLVGYLQTQLAAAQASVLDLTVKVRDLSASSEVAAGNLAAMRAITCASVDRLRVAMGHAAGGAEALTDTELLAAHATLRGQFEQKFKAGGVAAVSSSASSDKEGSGAEVSPVHMGRIKATRA